MWKNILATAFLILSIGVTYKFIQSANAQLGPQVSMGQNPIVNYGGSVPSNGLIVTAPADQDIIITTFFTNGQCSVEVGGVSLMEITSYFYPTYLYTRAGYSGGTANTSFTMGNGKLKVPAGQDLVLTGCNGAKFYMDGYSMHP